MRDNPRRNGQGLGGQGAKVGRGQWKVGWPFGPLGAHFSFVLETSLARPIPGHTPHWHASPSLPPPPPLPALALVFRGACLRRPAGSVPPPSPLPRQYHTARSHHHQLTVAMRQNHKTASAFASAFIPHRLMCRLLEYQCEQMGLGTVTSGFPIPKQTAYLLNQPALLPDLLLANKTTTTHSPTPRGGARSELSRQNLRLAVQVIIRSHAMLERQLLFCSLAHLAYPHATPMTLDDAQ